MQRARLERCVAQVGVAVLDLSAPGLFLSQSVEQASYTNTLALLRDAHAPSVIIVCGQAASSTGIARLAATFFQPQGAKLVSLQRSIFDDTRGRSVVRRTRFARLRARARALSRTARRRCRARFAVARCASRCLSPPLRLLRAHPEADPWQLRSLARAQDKAVLSDPKALYLALGAAHACLQYASDELHLVARHAAFARSCKPSFPPCFC
jgi:hypothetical protein